MFGGGGDGDDDDVRTCSYVCCCRGGWAPIHWAAEAGHTSCVEVLIRGGADVHVQTK